MNTDSSTSPATETLAPDTYHRVVGPALQAAAETAGRRGHKSLFDDMPAMLALVDLVTRLADLHRAHDAAAVNQATLLDDAATAACVMVFQEAKLPAPAISQCLSALESAHRQLHAQSVLDGTTPYVAMAWSHLQDDQRDEARKCLTQACEHAIAAIELWRRESS